MMLIMSAVVRAMLVLLLPGAALAGCAKAAAPAAPKEPIPCAPLIPTEPPPAAEAPVIVSPPIEAGPERVTLDYTEIVPLESEETGRKYELWIALPPSYAAEPERKYPTLYLLDGQWDFTLVRALAGGLLFDQVAPEFLIVGITYGGESPDYATLRAEDYIPTRAMKPGEAWLKGGDAAKFLSFLEQRVLPLSEERYRADPEHRILAGASYGGLFTLFALFERPELFQTYLALSPSVAWDERWLFRREAEFHRTHPRLERRVWLSVGTEEWPDYTAANRQFFAQFERRRYEGAKVRVKLIDGEHHAGNKPEAYNRAIRFAFEPD